MTNSPDKQRAKDIIVELIREAGGTFPGKTRLFKAFYFAHLYYYRDTPGLLSDWPIVQMPQGPGIDDGDMLLAELERDGVIARQVTPEGPYTEECYELVSSGSRQLDPEEADAIIKAWDYVKGKSATELSAITHEMSYSWNSAKPGQPLHIYMDVLSEKDRDEGLARQAEIANRFGAMFS